MIQTMRIRSSNSLINWIRSMNQIRTVNRINPNLIVKRNLNYLNGRTISSVLIKLNVNRLNESLIQTKRYCGEKTENEIKPEDRIKKIKEEIENLKNKINNLKGQSNDKEGKEIKIEEGKYDKQSGDEEVIYRSAYDFPGFKLKNIKITVVDKILRVYAFQTSSKKDKNTKEYIYEHTTEEILPNEIDLNKIRATFDAENGLLIVEAILPDDCDLKEIQKQTKELNDNLFKFEKELEAKKKELSSLKIDQ